MSMDEKKLKEAIDAIKVIEDMIRNQKEKVQQEQRKLREFRQSLAKWKNERHRIIEGCQT